MTVDEQEMKPPLTVLVGAGASIPIGLPSTRELTKLVAEALPAADSRFTDVEAHRAAAEKLLTAARHYYRADWLTFEHLLELLEAADALVVGWRPKNAPTVAEACLTVANPELAGVLDPDFVTWATFNLMCTIVDAIGEASARAPEHAAWRQFASFWANLAREFTLTIGTLNYDNTIEHALELGPTDQGLSAVEGENVWRLDVRRLRGRTAGHRLFHLHGSIHLGGREYDAAPNKFAYEDSFHELYWHATPESAARASGTSTLHSQAGRLLRAGRIITGLHKPDKLLIEPLASYHHELAEQIARCGRLLIIGYGFEDLHVNALLGRAAKVHGENLRVAVIDQVDTTLEFGSHARARMFQMLSRWGKKAYRIEPFTNPYPWAPPSNRVRFYWKGFLEAAQRDLGDLLAFLNQPTRTEESC